MTRYVIDYVIMHIQLRNHNIIRSRRKLWIGNLIQSHSTALQGV